MSHEHDAVPRDATPPRRKRRMVLKLCVLLVVLVIAGLGTSVYLLRSDPQVVITQRALMASKTPDELHTLSQSLQNKVAALTRMQLDADTQRMIASGQATPAMIREAMLNTVGQVRTINLTLPEINAWLGVELPQYLENAEREIPNGVSDPGLAIEGENLVAFFQLKLNDMEQTVSLIFTLQFSADGPASVKLLQVRGGRLPVPRSVVEAQAGRNPNSQINAIAEAFDGADFDPVLHHLQDQVRQPRVIGMTVNPDSIDLTIRIDAVHAANKPRAQTKMQTSTR